MIDLTALLLAILGVFVSLIGVYFLPYLKRYVDISFLTKIASIAVQFVEEDLWENKGSEKRAEALRFIKTKLEQYKITIDDDTINAYISAAVTALIRKEVK